MNHVQDAKPLSDHQKRTVRKYRLYSGVTVFLALSYKSFLTIKSIATSHDADLMYAWDQHTITIIVGSFLPTIIGTALAVSLTAFILTKYFQKRQNPIE